MALMTSDMIHPTAVIGPEVELGAEVSIGPYAILEGPIRIGSGCVIEAHACLSGPLEMGEGNFVGHGAVLGKPPQHKGYRGEETWLRIGSHNTFREHVTIHRGTVEGGGVTLVGDRNLLMVNSHVGHDARVGNGCTLVNNALVAGHCILMDQCILSGHAAIQQRVRVGRLAMLGGLGSTTKDIPPFILQQGYNSVVGLNLVGLRRAGMSSATIDALRTMYRIVYLERCPLPQALDRAEAELGSVPEVREYLEFVRESKLGINRSRFVRGTHVRNDD
ncbi:acyl-(acyl-carrier-protein)--UDP-N-acetylglucosa mineO-acyltransferase [Isosphaera pallida ATCC 43644]|jgi:UDP-N-acetylglucosamine acyltransferase|uniref:Acyl-(Acyl-carrier-protein)--UDP-N-acetylglucosa mineO-acyltransferase n=1 Tax=Isosphaera pallida (strain ATCC 43644 / DSM 9630 / IS1B) TaxID=575540 RepID=E8QYJ5_ISOPI|nr:acyl-ACP--UDP-N-acetylglucosamine O-acyltransferase [Isosphaera pallida]ADV64178.1 acyl-(acyl-carrier-protein)--UDP-N-acetylglucosa mineO-acyltransferase [Isosphaera pallida ATCC 43644]